MRKNIRKALAGILTLTMVVTSTSLTVLADSSQTFIKKNDSTILNPKTITIIIDGTSYNFNLSGNKWYDPNDQVVITYHGLCTDK